MKILSIGTHLFASTWRELGHTVRVIADYDLPPHPGNSTFDFFSAPRECEAAILSLVGSFRPEVIFQGDRSTPLIHCGLENGSLPKVWYAIDTHLHHAWHRHYAAAFDTVFLAQKNLLPIVKVYAGRAEWLPLFCQHLTDFVPWSKRTVPVSFVGTKDPLKNPDRARFFESLSKAGVTVQAAKGAYMPVYTASTVVVNQSVADDLNLRFFEATGCGALLVTDRLSWPVGDILEEGIDFLAYEHNNAGDCAEKIRWALAHRAEAETIARSAYGKIRAGHMVQHRAKRVLEEFGRLAGSGPVPARDPQYRIAHMAWTHYLCSMLDIPQRLAGFFAERSEKLASQCSESPAGRPWSLMVSACLAMNKGDISRANALLAQLTELPTDDDFKTAFYSLRIQLCALDGRHEDAFAFLAKASQEFPDSKVFKELEGILKNKFSH